MFPLQEYDRVKTLTQKSGFPAGSTGVVVGVYSAGPACEVEIWDDRQYPVDVVTCAYDEIELLDRIGKE